jgi:hypothetical protein
MSRAPKSLPFPLRVTISPNYRPVIDTATDLKGIKDLLKQALRFMAISSQAIEEIYIADTHNYSEDVVRFCTVKGQNETVSDNVVYQGVGKTFERTIGGKNVSCVIYRSNIVREILMALYDEQLPPFKGRYPQMSWYVVCHELGHVRDHVQRPLIEIPGMSEVEYQPEQIDDRYLALLNSEYAACYFAARGMGKDAYAGEVESSYDNITKQIEYLQRDQNPIWLHTTAWELVLSYAKLFAHAHGKPDIKAGERWPSEEVCSIIEPLRSLLRERWESYPKLDTRTDEIKAQAYLLIDHLSS